MPPHPFLGLNKEFWPKCSREDQMILEHAPCAPHFFKDMTAALSQNLINQPTISLTGFAARRFFFTRLT